MACHTVIVQSLNALGTSNDMAYHTVTTVVTLSRSNKKQQERPTTDIKYLYTSLLQIGPHTAKLFHRTERSGATNYLHREPDIFFGDFINIAPFGPKWSLSRKVIFPIRGGKTELSIARLRGYKP